MSQFFVNMLGPWQWAALAVVPPAIVALYFLKLRRTPLEVPSTYLWKKSIEDLHVNSLWQRLRTSLLLFLQLLLVILAILALLRPGWKGTSLAAGRLILLIDNSASMGASDVSPSRLDEAKRRAGELVDQMPTGGQAMIISFSDEAQVVQEFTDNRQALRQRIKTIRPTNHPTRIDEALQLASGVAHSLRGSSEPPSDNPGVDEGSQDSPPLAELFIFSDGNIPESGEVSLGGLLPQYVPIGAADAENFAITAFTAVPHEREPGRWEAFAKIANFSRKKASRTVELYIGDRLANDKRIEIEPGSAAGVDFELGEMSPGALRLELGEADQLAVDDVAYAVIDEPRKARVLFVSPGDIALFKAFSTAHAGEITKLETAEPAVLATQRHKDLAAAGAYDLIVYDQCAPETMPEANTLFVGRLPPLPEWRPAGEPAPTANGPQIIDINRAHPIMHLIELDDVLIGECMILAAPRGGTVLADSDQGPIMAIAPRGGFEDAVLGFEIVHTEGGQQRPNTTWVRGKLSFPVFCLNVLQYLGGRRTAGSDESIAPGQSITFTAETPGAKLVVHGPGGLAKTLAGSQQGTYYFQDTEQTGDYEVHEQDRVLGRFAVNLFDQAESDISVRAESDIPIGGFHIAGRTHWAPARRELWKILLFSALVVLLLEWYIYNRRVYI